MAFFDDIAVFYSEFTQEAKVTGRNGNFRCQVIYDAEPQTWMIGNNEFDSASKAITVKDSDGKRIEREAIIELACGISVKAMRPGRVNGTGIIQIPVTLK